MRYEVQHYTLCGGWVNTWTICDGDSPTIPHLFDSKQDAQAELNEFLQDIESEIRQGERQPDEGYDVSQFRIVAIEAKAQHHDKSMQSLADFKRQLKTHKGLWRFTWQYKGECRTGLRKVVHLQSNAVAMWREGGACLEDAIANPHKSATWLQFPKASECRFEGHNIIIQGEGDPIMMAYEKLPHKEPF